MIVNMPLPGLAGWAAGHRKLLVVVFGALVTVAVQVWGTSNPLVSLAVLAATSLGVYRVPNIAATATARGRPAAAPAPAAPALPAAGSGGAAGTGSAGAAGTPPSAFHSPLQ
jgi:hypothetical protein